MRLATKLATSSIVALVAATPAATAQHGWLQSSPTTSPPASGGHGMVLDSGRNLVVLVRPAGPTLETWEHDGSNWTQRTPTISPPTRVQFSIAYDPLRQRTVLYGGAYLSDTWEYDGTTWVQHNVATNPGTRCCAPMAYDRIGRRVLLFGGYDTATVLADTWAWDGTAWTQLNPTASPPARCCTQMTLDAGRSRILMFGGASGAISGDLADTWEWLINNWVQRTPTNAPSTRRGAHLAYDSARGRIVLFGGGVGGSGQPRLGDTWEWNGSDWQQTASSGPSPRWLAAMAYDPLHGGTLLLGGSDTANRNDTWRYSSTSLISDRSTLSLLRGGTQKLTLEAGSANAGKVYLILGSASGTLPGFPLGRLQMLLNPDAYFNLLLVSPNSLILGSVGLLDANGRGTATFVLPAGAPAALAGTRLYHAFVAIKPVVTSFDFTSDPVPLTLLQ
jgi:hypothetical protein